MAENRGCERNANPLCRETVCIDCNRVLDSCRDKDCFDDTRVYLTDYGQDIIEKTTVVRVKCAKIIGVNINLEPVQFNRGFYKVYIRFYVRLSCEGCVCPGRPQEFEGICVCEKSVILYGSEGSASIFRSGNLCDDFCTVPTDGNATTNLPTAVLETVEPVCLGVKVVEHHHNHHCCCRIDEIPENICGCINGSLTDGHDECRRLLVTLGFFSVIRIERPAQFLVSAAEYSVPDKECVMTGDSDPCSLFDKMAFPVNEFSPPPYRQTGCK